MNFESTSFHEAGHGALMLLSKDIFGAPRIITALPGQMSAGFIMPSGKPPTSTSPKAFRAYGRILAAGAVAEKLAGFPPGGIGSDAEQLAKLAALAKRGNGFVRECVDGAELLLRLNWGGVVGIVEALRACGGSLVAPHGIDLARTKLRQMPVRPLGCGLETLMRLITSLEGIPEIAAPLRNAIASLASGVGHGTKATLEARSTGRGVPMSD
jgi:hypothetical protein